MNTKLSLLLAGLLPMACLAAPAPSGKTGLAAMLADDDRVIGEVVRRDITSLEAYLFKKHNVAPDRQKAYRAGKVIEELINPASKLTEKEKKEGWNTVVPGIDNVLPVLNTEEKLFNSAAMILNYGVKHDMNLLEYWGEDPRIQAHLRPAAEAVAKVYTKGIALAEKRKEAIEARMNNAAAQQQLQKDWDKVGNMVALGKYNAAFNQYALALAIDRADNKRLEACNAGIEELTNFADVDQFNEIALAAKVGIGKLQMAKATKEAGELAKAQFAEVLKHPKSTWNSKFEAIYFTAVADLTTKDLAAAKQNLDAVKAWLAANPASEAAKKGTDAAVEMLRFRVLSLDAELAATPDARNKANEEAVAVLQELEKSQPDLRAIIGQQMLTHLPENADMKSLNPLMLKLLQGRAFDEASKPEDQPVDKKIVNQGSAAAHEILARLGKDGFGEREADDATFVIGLFASRLGRDGEACRWFVDYLLKFPKADPQARNAAFQNALIALAKLRASRSDSPEYKELYPRFLDIATGPAFKKSAFNLEYVRWLIVNNAGSMGGQSMEDARRKALMANCQKAAALARGIPEDKKLYARYYEMLAYDQLIDLQPGSATLHEWIAKITGLSAEVNTAIAAEMPRAATNDAKNALRGYRVKTALLVADLAKHDKGATRKQSLEQALNLLKDIDTDVKALPDAAALLPSLLYMRVDTLLSLGKAEQAMNDLKTLVTTQPENAMSLVTNMVDALNKEYDQARRNKDEARMGELSAHIAVIADYLVSLARESKNPDVKKALPDYERFRIMAQIKAANLEKDPAKKKKLLSDALAGFQELLKRNPADEALPLQIAHVQFELGEFVTAQPIFAKYLTEGKLGKPLLVHKRDDGSIDTEWNDVYWDCTHKMLKANAEMIKRPPANIVVATVKDATVSKLQQLFVMYQNEPGGPNWAPLFEELRKELCPQWTPPPPLSADALKAAATQPSTQRAK